jgi:hypothetical protein
VYKNVLMFDLEALKDEYNSKPLNKKQFNYHFKLLKGNLTDLFKLINS